MPIFENGRDLGRKRIALGDSFVDIPVIREISFIDPSEQFWETRFKIDNSEKSTRKVHIINLKSTQGNDVLAVERIDLWPVKEPNGQESYWALDNVTGEENIPPHFSTHLKTHVYRYKNPDNENVWIDCERIDQIIYIEKNGQETLFLLKNIDQQADPDWPNITTEHDSTAIRLDPFQNIIDFNSGEESNTGGGYDPFSVYYTFTIGMSVGGGGNNGTYFGGCVTGSNIFMTKTDPAGPQGAEVNVTGTAPPSASWTGHIDSRSQITATFDGTVGTLHNGGTVTDGPTEFSFDIATYDFIGSQPLSMKDKVLTPTILYIGDQIVDPAFPGNIVYYGFRFRLDP